MVGDGLNRVRSRRQLFHGVAGIGLAVPISRTVPKLALVQDVDSAPVDSFTISEVIFGAAGGQDLTMSVYLPPHRDKARPAVLAIHGGGFTTEGGSMAPAAQELARAGYATFIVSYRLLGYVTNENGWPAQLDDIQRAVRWIRANADAFGVDPERVGAYGRSSGGYLAGLLGTMETRDNSDPELAAHSSRVNCVASFDGEMDLTLPYENLTDTESLSRLLGGTISEVPDAYREASPITHVDERTAPFLLFSCAGDPTISDEHARRMVATLNELSTEVVFIELHVGHMEIAGWPLTGPYILAFFDRYLRPDS